ncbi:ASCH domain-containing protein [Ancylomarina salipaludis]|nr:ASCH domain-containing protein [Ancylomarina salipaludis]
MTRIHFHESFYDMILQGEKTQTARIEEPHYPLGTAMADFSDGKSLPIEIVEITYQTINEMSLSAVQKDGFNTKDELWNALLGFYPHLQADDLLMLVEFRCIMNKK